ncbi:MAG: TonB-dependent receptor [Bacteroidales bacterium]|nr:TonB-dependent receptor [Bacteroidales bacterium]MBO4566261.1 TonB-dependent receptor [Bacteroidales bacterium]
MKHPLLSSLCALAAILLLPCVHSPEASAQEGGKLTVTGVVTDELGEPMIGAGVLVKNTVNGAITNLDGEYTITVDAIGGGGVLIFSSIGYADQEIAVNGREVINVQMQLDQLQLEEVVVVGYGTQKRESVVGAISTVDVSNIKVPSAQLSSGLAGQLSGVVAVQRSGQPGSSSSDFYIRGVSSFQGTVTPLVLVDGVERDIDLVDTDDIASFSILKDASASAVYGVRGANGVILITTKKGDVGRPKINIREETGITQPLIMPRFVNSEQFATMYNWAKGEAYFSEEDIQHYISHDDPDLYPDVNWMETMYRPLASNERVNVSISGGTDVVRYFVSGSYYTESSIFRNAKNVYDYDSSISYDKFNFRANVDINLTESTVLALNVANIYETRVSPGTDSGTIWSWAFSTSPNTVPYEYSDGTLSKPDGTLENPWNLLAHTGYAESFTNSAQSVISLTQDFGKVWEPLEGLSGNMKFSWDAWNYQYQSRTKTPRQYHAQERDEDGNLVFGDPIVEGSTTLSYGASGSSSMNTYLEGSLTYNRLFGDHRVGGMFLYNHSIKRTTLGGSDTTSLPYKNQGVAGRVTYAFKDRYFAEFNVGYNGSENFAPGHRFGFFPAVSAGYLISEENFWAPLRNTVNMFKFKGSYGKVGNDQIGGARWLYLPTVITGNYATLGETGGNGGYGLAIGRPENLNFSWEEELKFNAGVEFELWHSLRVMADYFDSHRYGILMQRGGLPGIAGYQNGNKLPYVNVGETRNRGVDMSMEYHKQVGDLYLAARGNFTYNRNNLVNNDEPDWKYLYQNRIGKPYGVGASQPWGLVAIGLFESEEEIANSPVQTFGEYRVGDIKYQDINGDGRVDADDRVYLGFTNLPEITYGFGMNAEYKGFDINVFFQGIGNVNFFVSGSSLTSPFSSTAIGRSAVQLDVWENGWDRLTNNGEDLSRAKDAIYPRLSVGSAAGSSNNQQTSSWWQRDGSFLRLKNFEMGYNIPKPLLARLGIVQSLRVYISGSNLFTFSKFNLWDPEQGGGQGASYPNNRVYSFGLNANF